MKPVCLLFVSAFLLVSCREDKPKSNYVRIDPADTPEQIVTKASEIAPSKRQLAWQDLEFTAFVHFGMNTFTNREWGEGTEDPAWFNPTAFDAWQWVKTAQSAGMKMIIVTAKHHDGFCLWPSAYTSHSVKSSPWKKGHGDIVGEVAEACHEGGIKFGIYLSPWDRHEQSYGTDQYNDHFVNQLTELLTNYGRVDEVWFDGACGEGPNGKRQIYDWLRYYTLIRKLQPEATIAVMGPDVRWVGTESGYGRSTEWSVIPYGKINAKEIAAKSQQAPVNGIFIPAGDMMEQDLGSRNKIVQAPALIWYPSEVDVSIRPGWFYHPEQDGQVKTPGKLLDIWFASVGQNSLLLLNVPPDKRGLIHENDVAALVRFKQIRDSVFNDNLAGDARVTASSTARGFKAGDVLTAGRENFWMPKKDETVSWLEFGLSGEKTFDCLQIRENIEFGQRIEQFSLEIWKDNQWSEVVNATTVGACRLLRFPQVTASRARLRIIKSRNTPSISYIGLHKQLSGRL
ncbi:MAG: alpha-L-fucosidase [Bacteroidota bacterium]